MPRLFVKVGGVMVPFGPGSGVSDHGGLAGLLDDDHIIYILVDGTRDFTGVVKGVTPTLTAHLATKGYSDVQDGFSILSDGTRPFSGDQSMGSNKITNLKAPVAGADAQRRDGTIDRGTTYQTTATALPVSPQAGDRILITDDSYAEYIYTGAKWLSTAEYVMYFDDDVSVPVGNVNLSRNVKVTDSQHKWFVVPGEYTITAAVIGNRYNVVPDSTQSIKVLKRSRTTSDTSVLDVNWDGAEPQANSTGLSFDVADLTGLSARYVFSATGTVPNGPCCAVYFRRRKV